MLCCSKKTGNKLRSNINTHNYQVKLSLKGDENPQNHLSLLRFTNNRLEDLRKIQQGTQSIVEVLDFKVEYDIASTRAGSD